MYLEGIKQWVWRDFKNMWRPSREQNSWVFTKTRFWSSALCWGSTQGRKQNDISRNWYHRRSAVARRLGHYYNASLRDVWETKTEPRSLILQLYLIAYISIGRECRLISWSSDTLIWWLIQEKERFICYL